MSPIKKNVDLKGVSKSEKGELTVGLIVGKVFSSSGVSWWREPTQISPITQFGVWQWLWVTRTTLFTVTATNITSVNICHWSSITVVGVFCHHSGISVISWLSGVHSVSGQWWNLLVGPGHWSQPGPCTLATCNSCGGRAHSAPGGLPAPSLISLY